MRVDFVASWERLLGIFPDLGGIFTVAGIVGMVILVIALGGWIWQRRRGGSGGFPWLTLIFCSILAAPVALIPALLWITSVLASLGLIALEALQSIVSL